jgi:hypothetical protein
MDRSARGIDRDRLLDSVLLSRIPNQSRRRAAEGRARRFVSACGISDATLILVTVGATEQEDDFSWEDEDEDTAPKGEPLSLAPPVGPILNSDQIPATIIPGAMSPQRSDDSFDFVSSAHTSVTGDAASAAHARTKEGSGGDNGDDEGEEGKEDGDDRDEDEDESDWE